MFEIIAIKMASSSDIDIEIESTISTKNTDQTITTSENGESIQCSEAYCSSIENR